jgi:F-type H+-transporting ATPase subunit delta
MAENITVARPYAEAVFGLADADRTRGEWAKMLDAMANVAAHGEVRAAIGNPNLSVGQLYGLFASLCGELTTEAQNFVRVLIENRRLAVLPEIRDIYLQLKNERESVVDALITTAFALDGAQVGSLVADLERRFARKINPQVKVDKELIGGVHVQVGDEVIDGSVRGKLVAMAAELTT